MEKAPIDKRFMAEGANAWISTQDELPPARSLLLFVEGGELVHMGYFMQKGDELLFVDEKTNAVYCIADHVGLCEGVTHWLPIPPSPMEAYLYRAMKRGVRKTIPLRRHRKIGEHQNRPPQRDANDYVDNRDQKYR